MVDEAYVDWLEAEWYLVCEQLKREREDVRYYKAKRRQALESRDKAVHENEKLREQVARLNQRIAYLDCEQWDW